MLPCHPECPHLGLTGCCHPGFPSSQPPLQDQQRRLQQPLPALAGWGAQVCLSHQLLPGQRWQNLRVQLHSQPGKPLPACPCLSLTVPDCLGIPCAHVPPAVVSPDCSTVFCGCRQHLLPLAFHVWGCSGVPETLQLWNVLLSLKPQGRGGVKALLWVGIWEYLEGTAQDRCPWLSSLGMKSFGVPPPHPEPPHELLSPSVCLQERQVHPFLVEMRHRGRLRGPVG